MNKQLQKAYEKVQTIIRQPLNVYLYGSRVYGCNAPDADYDFLVITPNITIQDPIIHQDISISVYSLDDFETMVEAHDIVALECIYARPEHILCKEWVWALDLDRKQLRKSISAKASHSWVKAKKKFQDKEIYIAKKSLLHSLRILMFGIQIAEKGMIVDYGVANELWHEIMKCPETEWHHYDDVYRWKYNELHSAFKKETKKWFEAKK